MVFGEIIEPSTRALIDDELDEYPEYSRPDFKWEGDCQVPSDLYTLIIFEGGKIVKFANALISDKQLYCSSQTSGIRIYKSANSKYFVVYEAKNVATGEIIEELVSWFNKAVEIYAIASEPLSAYQNPALTEKPETLIRKLDTNNQSVSFNCEKLESPNLVSGLGADVLSFCLHTNLKSVLFVIYMDNSPLDSINTKPVIELLSSLDLSLRLAPNNLNPISNNLYL